MTLRPHVVVLRALGLGDFLTAVPALRAIARAHPDHRTILAAPAWQAALARLSGAVDLLAPAAPLAPLPGALRGADLAVNLHGRGPQSTARLRAIGPDELIAFDVPGRPPWRDDEHDRDRWCRLLASAGIPADPTDFRIRPPGVDADSTDDDFTLLHPGAASAARRWPPERWAAVARAAQAQGRRVVITGSAGEATLAHQVAARGRLPPSAVLAGRTDVSALVRLVARAGRVVCSDTGIAHVTYALGVPSVVLFGPVSPAHWGPPAGPHVALWHGRTGDPHGDALDPGLAAITVEEVLAALEQLPTRTR